LAPQPCASLTLPSSAATATLALHPPLLHHTGVRRRDSPLSVPLRPRRPVPQHRQVPLRRATGTRSPKAPSSGFLHDRRPPPPPVNDANLPTRPPCSISGPGENLPSPLDLAHLFPRHMAHFCGRTPHAGELCCAELPPPPRAPPRTPQRPSKSPSGLLMPRACSQAQARVKSTPVVPD